MKHISSEDIELSAKRFELYMIDKHSLTNVKDNVYMNVEPRKNVDIFNLMMDTYSK